VVFLLLILTGVSKSPSPSATIHNQENQRNLAMRAIADHLLKQNGDLYSPIPPIRRETEGNYFISLGTPIEYLNLRSIIDTILLRHQIRPDYRLSLLDCESGALALGFLADLEDKERDIPCQQREQIVSCYDLRIALISQGDNLTTDSIPLSTPNLKWALIGLAICFPIVLWTWTQKSKVAVVQDQPQDGWQNKTQATSFHLNNQVLKIDQQSISLTYREAKLLNFFFENANQVLERDTILQAVWEDEGIIVGRSLDVFVSRLRKKLKGDPALSIVNVHGVGYRLEVIMRSA
jgi:hypothetical protein